MPLFGNTNLDIWIFSFLKTSHICRDLILFKNAYNFITYILCYDNHDWWFSKGSYLNQTLQFCKISLQFCNMSDKFFNISFQCNMSFQFVTWVIRLLHESGCGGPPTAGPQSGKRNINIFPVYIIMTLKHRKLDLSHPISRIALFAHKYVHWRRKNCKIENDSDNA